VPGEGGLHGNFRGFQVANLADEDDVRILPQDGPPKWIEAGTLPGLFPVEDPPTERDEFNTDLLAAY
jgi:hypothetical protein